MNIFKTNIVILSLTISTHILEAASSNHIDTQTILIAARDGNTQALGDSKAKGFNFNESDPYGFTVAHYAAVGGSLNSLKWLKRNGIPLDQNNKKAAVNSGKRKQQASFATPYELIIRTLQHCDKKQPYSGCADTICLKNLTEKNGLKHSSDFDRNSRKILTHKKRLRCCLRFLKSCGAHHTRVDITSKNTGLHFAARQNNIAAIKSCLKKNVPINAQNMLKKTALHEAAHRANLQSIEVLIANKADVHAQDINGKTPAHLIVSKATRHNKNKNPISEEKAIKCLKLLIEKGSYNISTKDNGCKWYQYGHNSANVSWPKCIIGYAQKNSLKQIYAYLINCSK